VKGFDVPGHESASAELRRVQAERDQALAELASARQELDRLRERLGTGDET